MRLAGYVRVSRVGGREGDSFISPGVQRQQIEGYAAAHGHELVAWFEDLDVSGAKASRPHFDLALDAVERGDADGLIVAKLDRFMRSLPDALKVIQRLEVAGRQLVSVSDNFDSSTTMGRFARDLVLRLGQLELERISDSWKSAQSSAVKRGIHIASRTPTGYRRREDRRLEPDPVAAPVIHELFVRRGAGEGWSELARFMNGSGVVGPYGSPNWTPTAVRSMVENRAYLGEARSGVHVNPDAHHAIVTEAEWRAAEARRGRTYAPKRAEDALLSGLVRCAGCRYRMKTERKRYRGGEMVRTYHCRKNHASGDCKAPAFVMAHILEPYVEAEFLNSLGDPPHAAGSASTADLAAAEEVLRAAELELETYLSAVDASVVGADEFRKNAVHRRARVVAAREAFVSVRPAAQELRVSLLEVWDELSVQEKRELLAAEIDAVFVRRVARDSSREWADPVLFKGRVRQRDMVRRAHIVWQGEAPPDLPRRGLRPAAPEPFTWDDDDEDTSDEGI